MLSYRFFSGIGPMLVLATGLLAGCRDAPPDTPSSLTAPKSKQYGTPFAGVPDRADAVLYEVNIRAFSPAGNFAGVTARLDSIKALGVNVLYLMPIYPIGKERAANSTYSVQDYQAVNPEFGTLADLRTLVDEAHARGLAVMLDWVANHTSWDNAWIRAHPDWYLRDAGGTIVSPNPDWTDVAQLDFTRAPMRQAMIDAMKSWVYTANVDGFRCDYADEPPVDFWRQAIDTLRQIRTHRLLLLAEGTRPGNFAAGFDYNFSFSFYPALRGAYAGAAATSLDTLAARENRGASSSQQVVRFTTNHDLNASDGPPATLFGGQQGDLAAFVIAACYQGVPMVYNGQEAGMRVAIPEPAETISWGQYPAVTRAYQQLLAARTASVALRRGTPASYGTNDVCAFTKTAGSEQALVLANVRNAGVRYPVPAALAGTTWANALNGASVALGSEVALPPYGYLVLKR